MRLVIPGGSGVGTVLVRVSQGRQRRRAIFMRTESELVQKSRRVYPERLLDNGFHFRYPRWREAARGPCQRWRQITRSSRPSLQNAGEKVSDVRSA